MYNKLFGVLGMLAGGGLVAHWWLLPLPAASLASTPSPGAHDVGYLTGQAYVAAFGAVLFTNGLVTFLKKPS